jgi:hypothetical protein
VCKGSHDRKFGQDSHVFNEDGWSSNLTWKLRVETFLRRMIEDEWFQATRMNGANLSRDQIEECVLREIGRDAL